MSYLKRLMIFMKNYNYFLIKIDSNINITKGVKYESKIANYQTKNS